MDPRFEKIEELSKQAPSGREITNVMLAVTQMLLEKNIAYGNSALHPVRVFSKSSTVEQLYVRLDDKLNRIQKGQSFPGDNDLDDMIGYLALLKVARGGGGST